MKQKNVSRQPVKSTLVKILLLIKINNVLFFQKENLNRDSTAQHRNRRRTIVADDINKTLANGNAASSLPKPSNEQLSCLYNNCVKLLNENVTEIF